MLNNLRPRIESIMYASDAEPGRSFMRRVLHAVSLLYGGVQVLRRTCYDRGIIRPRRLPCKVLSVGNLAVGGTGKTPMTAYLARALQDRNQRVVVISRGYKSRGGPSSHVVSDGRNVLMDALHSGDEAQLLARQLKTIPVLIGRDRFRAGIDAMARFQPDIIVLDDAFQHIRLHRDLDIVLLDARAPFGNHHLLPRGLLREPIAALKAADGIIFTRTVPDDDGATERFDFIPSQLPVFQSAHRPYLMEADLFAAASPADDEKIEASHDLTRLDGARVAAFSGIARNEEFQRTLKEHGADLVVANAFSDHHSYEASELRQIVAEARDRGVDFLATTEKDFVRLPQGFEWPLDLLVVGVEIDFGGQEPAFLEFLQSCLHL